MGPLAGAEQLERVSVAVAQAVASGASLRSGGPVTIPGLDGAFYAPAVLTGVTGGMPAAREAIPGPVVAVVVTHSEEEAVALAGDPAPAVGASVWTRDAARGERVARRLRAGTVWVNDHAWPGAAPLAAPVELRAAARPKVLAARASRLPAAWWHPHDQAVAEALGAWVATLYGREDDRLAALRAGARPLLRLAARLARDAGRS